MKEEMSSFDIAAVTAEIDPILCNARIDNVYQINPKTLLLKLRSPNQPQNNLIIEAGKRIHLTFFAHKKPVKPPTFCMALRKYVRNGRIKKIRQHEFERTIIIEIEGKGGEYDLISELFSRGNIILVGPENKILQALTYRRMKDRNVIRGEKFQYAPSSRRNPRTLKREDLDEMKKIEDRDIVRALTSFLSIGGLYAEEILIRAEVRKGSSVKSLKEEDLDRIYENIQNLLNEITRENMKPCVFIDDEDNWIDVTPTPLRVYSHLERKTYKTFNEALDEYYAKAFAKKRLSETEKHAGYELKRLEIILQDQEKAKGKLERDAEVYKEIGDIIYRYMNDLRTLIERVMIEKRGGKSWKEITTDLQREKEAYLIPAVYFHSLTPKNLKLKVCIEDQEFQLDLKSSIQENASRYYEQAKKAKRKLAGVRKAIRQTLDRIEELKGRIAEEVEEKSRPLPRRPKREWYEKFRWFYSSDGFLVIGGRDASANEVIFKKHTDLNDIVFHADVPGSPLVTVKTEGKPISEQTLKEAAQFTASYSRAWREMLTAINVYWVTPKQVSKHPPSGQYLPKGSFMIYGKKNYVRNVPLEIAVGIKKEGDKMQVIGGPVDAIAKQTNLYVRIVPGRETSSRVAKEIRRRLSRRLPKDEREEILRIPIEEIQRFIPSGKGAIRKD